MRKIKWNFLLPVSLVLAVALTALAIWQVQLALAPVAVPVLKQGSAVAYARLAAEFAEARQFSAAAELNQKALAYHPGSASLHYNQAWLAARQSEWKTALSELNQSLQLQSDAQTYVLRAWVYQKQGQSARSQQDLKQARQMNWQPATPLEQARVLQLSDQHQQALKAFDSLLSPSPPLNESSAEVYYWRSHSYEALGQNQQALDDLNQWLKQQPQSASYLQRGRLYLKLGQLPAAFADFQQSLALVPDPDVQKQRDHLWIWLAPEEALADFSQRPSDLQQQILVVRAQLALKQTKAAQPILDTIIKQNPRLAEAAFLQAQSFRLRRKYAEAGQALQRTRALRYDPQELSLEEARLLAQQGQNESAERRVRQILKASPELGAVLKQDRLLRRWAK